MVVTNGTHTVRASEEEAVDSSCGMNTLLVHAGVPAHRSEGCAIVPIYQTATFGYHGPHKEQYQSSNSPFCYTRCENPNQRVLGRKIAAIEGTEAAMVFGSGMAAINACVHSLLRPGDHLITQKTLYGGTYSVFYEELRKFGIELTAVDLTEPSSWKAAVRPNTKVIYVESISNPLLEVGDLKGVVAFAKKHKLISVIDSTFTPPVNFKPAAIGFDAVLHSATKYANGHSDICAGILAAKANIITLAMHKMEQYGGCLDPHACFLLQRGMATLKLRVIQQNKNGMAVAKFLASHPKVLKVFYPGLGGSTGHKWAKELFSGFGGVLSAELNGGVEAADVFQNALKLPLIAVSLGGVESLVCTPANSTHFLLGPEGRKAAGISDSLVRLALGIEDTEDLLADISQALDMIPG